MLPLFIGPINNTLSLSERDRATLTGVEDETLIRPGKGGRGRRWRRVGRGEQRRGEGGGEKEGGEGQDWFAAL